MLSKLDKFIKTKGYIIIKKEEGSKNTSLEVVGPKNMILFLLTSMVHYLLEQNVISKADLLDIITLAANKKGK